MPFPFSSIPEHIRNLVVQKLDAHDFGQFSESSRLSYSTAKKIRTKLLVSTENVVKVEENNGQWEFRIKFFGWFESIEWTVSSELLEQTPLQIVASEIVIQGSITQDLCEKLTKTLRRTYSSFDCLRAERFSCTPEAFNNLLITSKARKLVCNSTIPKEFVRVEAIKKMDDLDIDSYLDDKDLRSLKMRRMRLRGTNVTNSGLNSFVRDFFDRKREIIEVYIQLASQNIDEDIITRGYVIIPKVSTETSDNKPKETENRRRLTYYNSNVSIRFVQSVINN